MKKRMKKQPIKLEEFFYDLGNKYNFKDRPDETNYTAAVLWFEANTSCLNTNLIFGVIENNMTLDKIKQQIIHKKEQEYGKQNYVIFLFPGFHTDKIAKYLAKIQQWDSRIVG